MSRGALLLSAGLLVCGLSAPALAAEQGAFTGGVGLGGAMIVDEMTGQPYDYPPPYSAAHPYAHPRYHHYAYRYHHYAYRYRHYATSPYHRHSGIEPYSYYNPEK